MGRLRIVGLVLSLLLLGAVVVGWVRSYWVEDEFLRRRVGQGAHPAKETEASLRSTSGQVLVLWYERQSQLVPFASASGWVYASGAAREPFHTDTISWANRVGFGAGHVVAYLGKMRWVWVPWWAITAVVTLPVVLLARRSLRAYRVVRSRRAGSCVQCGYDLRASPGRCPECGAEVVGSVSASRPVGDGADVVR